MRGTCWRRAVVTLAFFASVAMGRDLRACRCRELSVGEAYRRAALVVLAEAVGVRARPDVHGDELELRVQRAWKEDSPQTVKVVTGTDCAYAVRPGETHLLFLVRAGDVLTTGRCMGNVAEKNGNGALAWLRRHGRAAAVSAHAP